uniref:AB hydrolase-1 domain-containing protein n=1 Tax=Arion vulgaris TaxID=1028688 RepID=A0A0B7BFI2_9EUPU
MAELLDSIKLWATAIFFGILAILHTLKQLVTKGPSNVFYWKQWDRPQILDDPRLGTHGFLTLKDVRIHYVASGPEDKPLMLFVHGFPEFWYSWRHQIIEFQKDYRVVAIDQRGYNKSSKPSGKKNYSAVKLMSDIEQIIQALGYKSCILVGHDWGGLVTWVFSKHYPHLVDKLIVMNAPPFSIFKQFLSTSKDQAKKSWYVFFFQLPFLPELILKLENYGFLDDLLPSKHKLKGSAVADSVKMKTLFLTNTCFLTQEH